MATKKLVSLLPTEKHVSQADPNTLETFRHRTPEVCRHITSYGDIEDRSELSETTTLLLTQIRSLFFALASLPTSSDEDTQALCILGRDLAREAQRRVGCLYDEV
jgi:hypothetical protein